MNLEGAVELGVCFHKGPILGSKGGCSFSRAFERRVRFIFIRRTFIAEIQGYVKEGSGNGNSLHRAPLREHGGVSSTGTFEW